MTATRRSDFRYGAVQKRAHRVNEAAVFGEYGADEPSLDHSPDVGVPELVAVKAGR